MPANRSLSRELECALSAANLPREWQGGCRKPQAGEAGGISTSELRRSEFL
jgi:hypothetical protein